MDRDRSSGTLAGGWVDVGGRSRLELLADGGPTNREVDVGCPAAATAAAADVRLLGPPEVVFAVAVFEVEALVVVGASRGEELGETAAIADFCLSSFFLGTLFTFRPS